MAATRYLLSRGANPNKPCAQKNGGGMPLHRAINWPAAVQELLSARADPNAAHMMQGTALHMASYLPTVAHEDAKRARLETARLLLEAGAAREASRDRDSQRPVDVAQQTGFDEMASLLSG